MPEITTIGIVEDDATVRAMLADAAAECGRVAWQVDNLADSMAQLAQRAPDIVLIDLRLPDGDGLQLLPIAAQHAHCKCLVVSALGGEATVLRAIEGGAAGYLLKDQTFDELVAAIKSVIDGGAPMTPRIAMFVLKRLRARSPGSRPLEALTERETDILDGLARGMSYAEIGAARNLSYHTVNSHVKTIYRKLAVTSRNQAVYKALHAGLVRLHESD